MLILPETCQRSRFCDVHNTARAPGIDTGLLFMRYFLLLNGSLKSKFKDGISESKQKVETELIPRTEELPGGSGEMRG